MKKITLLLAGLMISGMASAAQLTASGTVTMADCTPLREDVNFNLSAGVQAGVFCTDTVAALAACHTGGKVTQRTVPVKTVPTNEITGVPEHLEPCTTPGTDGCASTAVTGPAMAAASTALGTVNTQYPGGNTCSAAGAETQATVMANQ